MDILCLILETYVKLKDQTDMGICCFTVSDV